MRGEVQASGPGNFPKHLFQVPPEEDGSKHRHFAGSEDYV